MPFAYFTLCKSLFSPIFKYITATNSTAHQKHFNIAEYSLAIIIIICVLGYLKRPHGTPLTPFQVVLLWTTRVSAFISIFTFVHCQHQIAVPVNPFTKKDSDCLLGGFLFVLFYSICVFNGIIFQLYFLKFFLVFSLSWRQKLPEKIRFQGHQKLFLEIQEGKWGKFSFEKQETSLFIQILGNI